MHLSYKKAKGFSFDLKFNPWISEAFFKSIFCHMRLNVILDKREGDSFIRRPSRELCRRRKRTREQVKQKVNHQTSEGDSVSSYQVSESVSFR